MRLKCHRTGWICFLVIINLLRSTEARKQLHHEGGHKKATLEPWQINEGICPPVLCGAEVSSNIREEGSVSGKPKQGYPFFEGDIVLDKELEKWLNLSNEEHSHRSKRDVIRPIDRLWKHGKIPYILHRKLSPQAKSVILNVMEIYKKTTCISFRKKTKSDNDYIIFADEKGCWSMVGRRKGAQMISIGRGCDNIGTVMHEIGHALGFWHEQSRHDRDKYVEVVTKNIIPKYISQFGKRSFKESTTLKYPYDYQSVMHYKEKDYSKNHRRTIKVIGIGEKLNFRIGKRERLSDLDVAQINAMYYCNAKSSTANACDKGWTLFKTSCYKFVKSKALNFASASEYCEQKNAHLVHINNAEEDLYLRNQLRKDLKYKRWRTGGKKDKSKQFKWFHPHIEQKNKYKTMKYKAWEENVNSPLLRKHSTLILMYNQSKNTYVWSGAFAGTKIKPEASAYPFICEKKRKGKCYKSKTSDGRDYRGRISYTESFITCQHWSEKYPHNHTDYKDNKAKDSRLGLGRHNYCRNPGGRRKQPWCYTSKMEPTWEYCEVHLCQN